MAERRKLDFRYIPLRLIDVSLNNVRKTHLEEGIEELAASIREIGVQQPVIVVEKGGNRYDLIVGQRRYLASQRAGEKDVPAVITHVDSDTEAVILSLSENIHRRDLDYRDKMNAALTLYSKFGSVKAVAECLGVSEVTVRRYMGYEAVPAEIKNMVDAGKLSANAALEIAVAISDTERATRIAQKVVEMPRRRDTRSNFLRLAQENPGMEIDQVVELAGQSQLQEVRVHLTRRVADALDKAARDLQTDAPGAAATAIEDWLSQRGFV